ncbi:hypothetical protein KM043_002160 [Ampulex compressa]|nr:hypothetical protein KM043_002160 [Ampulex compressa]
MLLARHDNSSAPYIILKQYLDRMAPVISGRGDAPVFEGEKRGPFNRCDVAGQKVEKEKEEKEVVEEANGGATPWQPATDPFASPPPPMFLCRPPARRSRASYEPTELQNQPADPESNGCPRLKVSHTF